LVEYDPGFCRLLAQRFSPARILQGDAYDLRRTLAGLAGQKIAAVVSSLPLLNQPAPLRAKLIEDAFALMGPTGIFVQFTYGVKSPVPRQACINKYSAHGGAPIWRNLPPARVWTYRADPNGIVAEPMFLRLCDSADRIGAGWVAKKQEAARIFGRQRARMRDLWLQDAKGALAAARLRRADHRRDPPPER
jgi:hypothetical protein